MVNVKVVGTEKSTLEILKALSERGFTFNDEDDEANIKKNRLIGVEVDDKIIVGFEDEDDFDEFTAYEEVTRSRMMDVIRDIKTPSSYNTPPVLALIDWSKVQESAEEYVKACESAHSEGGCEVDSDLEHFMFEEVMTKVYGNGIWDYLNPLS